MHSKECDETPTPDKCDGCEWCEECAKVPNELEEGAQLSFLPPKFGPVSNDCWDKLKGVTGKCKAEEIGLIPRGCGGTKNDLRKTRIGLIPTEAIEQIGKAFTHGAAEYGDYNYRKGIDYSRLYDAALRHLNAFWGGEDLDPDSGLPHLALAGSEICMLIAMGDEHDDRYMEGM